MGDLCDINDVERVLRSPEGRERLNALRRSMVGRMVVDVTFANDVHGIATHLYLDDGQIFLSMDPLLSVECLREDFPDVIRREYLVDYPDRRDHFT